MGQRALGEVEKANAAAIKAVSQLEEGTNGIIDQAQMKLSEFNQNVLKMKNDLIRDMDTAMETLEENIKKIGPEIKERGRNALEEAFSHMESFPQMFEEKLTGAKDEILAGIKKQVKILSNTASEKIKIMRGDEEESKERIISAFNETIGIFNSKLEKAVDDIAGHIGDISINMNEKFDTAYKGKQNYEKASAELESVKTDLRSTFLQATEKLSKDVQTTITNIETQVESTVNETFERFIGLIDEMPAKVEKSISGISDTVNAVLIETLDEASRLAKELISDAKDRLGDTIKEIGDTIDLMINEGLDLIKELRNEFVEALDALAQQIEDFIEISLNDIRSGAHSILNCVENEVEKGIEAARQAVNETVLEMGKKINQQIEKVKNDLTREAEKHSRQIRLMGEEAYWEAEEAFINAGYKEDKSVIPDIRSKGEEVIAEIQKTMDGQSDKLVREFQAQADLFLPTITAQGEKLVSDASGAGIKVTAECVRIGTTLASDISSKSIEFTDSFRKLSDSISGTIDGKGTEYIEMCSTDMQAAADEINRSGEDFIEKALDATTALIVKINERFGKLAGELQRDVQELIEKLVKPLRDAIKDTKSSFDDLNDSLSGTAGNLSTEYMETIQEFSVQMKSIIEEEMEKIRDGSMDALEGVHMLRDDVAGKIKEQGGTIIDEIKSGYENALEIGEKLEEIRTKVSVSADGLESQVVQNREKIEVSVNNLIDGANSDGLDALNITLKNLRNEAENVVEGLPLEQSAGILKDKFRDKTEEIKAAKDEFLEIGNEAKAKMEEVSAKSNEVTMSASKTGAESAKAALSEAGNAGGAIKEAGGGIREKLNEAVMAVQAAGEVGKAGMEAARSAAQPGAGKRQASDSGGSTDRDSMEAGGDAEKSEHDRADDGEMGIPDEDRDEAGMGVSEVKTDIGETGIPEAEGEDGGIGIQKTAADEGKAGIPEADGDDGGIGIQKTAADEGKAGIPEADRDDGGIDIPKTAADEGKAGIPEADGDDGGIGIPKTAADEGKAGIPEAKGEDGGIGIPETAADGAVEIPEAGDREEGFAIPRSDADEGGVGIPEIDGEENNVVAPGMEVDQSKVDIPKTKKTETNGNDNTKGIPTEDVENSGTRIPLADEEKSGRKLTPDKPGKKLKKQII